MNHCPTHTFEPNARKVVLGHWSQRALLEEVSLGFNGAVVDLLCLVCKACFITYSNPKDIL